jgi:class 3 adenylate cyclase
VTLLFTDVTGSTAMGEQLDPEAYRSLMGRYFDVARATVERHGGMVEKFVGDAVLAVFGMPEVHEDDALRAVRAARELNGAVAALSEQVLAQYAVRLTIRTGVNTGWVVTGPARAGGSFATGDAVNTAARLEQAAGDGEILLGESTYALVRDAVEVELAESVSAKGKVDPVPAYRLVRVLDALHGRRRRVDLALVGRAQESRALDDVLAQTVTSGRSHLVTVLGPPGIGKSRLVNEFLLHIGDRAAVARGRCVSYGKGITYWPLAQALRDALDLTGTESEQATRHALEQALGPCEDRDTVLGLLMPLVGGAGPPPDKEQTVWSVRRLVEELATKRPLVLSVDDLHWAEPTLLELLERVRDEVSDLPLLMLCQARPELLEEHPAWGSGPLDSMTFRLDPLVPAETEAAVAALLDGEVPAGLADQVASWAGGNPLFVEEIVAHLVETGILGREPGGGWRLVGDLAQAQLPPSVSALLASRLDRLPAAERDLLERGSVIGLEFTTAEVEPLVDEESRAGLAALLASLTRRDLVRRVRSGPGDTWAFKHILVRDAAYEALPKAQRADLHEHFADGVAARGTSDSAGELLGFVAHHLEQSARYRRELAARGPQVDALVDRAVEALAAAAEQARDADRIMDHGGYLDRALRLEPEASRVRRQILARLADHHHDLFQLDQLGRVLDSFEAELDDTADEREQAFLRTMRLYRRMVTGNAIDPAQVAEAAQELASLGRAAEDARSVVRGLRLIGECSTMLGLWRDAMASSNEIIRIGTPADARAARGGEYVALLWGDGTFRDCLAFLRRDFELHGRSDGQAWVELATEAMVAAADGSPDTDRAVAAAVARGEDLYAAGKISEPTGGLLAEALRLSRDLDGTIAYTERLNEEYRRSGALGVASSSILMQALLMLERGDSSDAVLPLIAEAEGYTSPYDVTSTYLLATCRAILAVRAGDGEHANELTDDALTAVDRTQETWAQADLRRWLSEIPRTTGDVELERRLLQEAAEMYARKEIRSYDAEIQARLAETAAATGARS